MHSLKNTAVAVLLLAVSFGLYQFSLIPQSQVDESQIPQLDISVGTSSSLGAGTPRENFPTFGSSSTAQDQRNAFLQSVPQMPPMPKFGTASPDVPDLQPPAALPNNLATKADSPRLPVVSETHDHVQTIRYPPSKSPSSSADSGFSLAQTPTIEQPLVSQREIVDPQLDDGLIAALKTQNESRDDNNLPDPSPALASAPIGTSTTGLDAGDTEFVSAEISRPNAFDPQVRQALVNPQAPMDFNSVWPEVDRQIARDDFRGALKLLSGYYRHDDLTGPQRQRLLGWLDALAGKVIFSAEHHLITEPYELGAQESLADVAAKWQVPAQLIYNVNQSSLPIPVQTTPGTRLKQIPGPFSAELNLSDKVLTLFLGDLYAGRFPVRLGISGEPQPGEFEVLVKSESGHDWLDANGTSYPPDSPQNGYGRNWIGLSGSLCLHAVADSAADGHHGCLGLSERDAKDVFAILSEGSILKIVE